MKSDIQSQIEEKIHYIEGLDSEAAGKREELAKIEENRVRAEENIEHLLEELQEIHLALKNRLTELSHLENREGK